jgi:uracil-DNA glycosylase
VIEQIPESWREELLARLTPADLEIIDQFVETRRKAGVEIHPPAGQEFAAFQLTPFDSVRAVIVGQDPYHEPGQAHGLAFSTLGDRLPLSLQNILTELCADCRYELPESGSLEPWARHGVLLLNTLLTVRRGAANSHAGHGWEKFTGAVVDAVSAKPGPIVFLLWGKKAQTQGRQIDRRRHIVIESAHPSPLSARRGFFGSGPFSRANAELLERHRPPIDWALG